MTYEHYTIQKRDRQDMAYYRQSSWLTDSDFDYMANEDGWLLVSVIQVNDITREYIFRREVKD